MMFSIFLIFTGAAVLATVALYARQSLLMAYILLGAIVGPAGFGMVDDPQLIEDIAHVGIIFLLFLLGLDLYPKKLLQLLKEATMVMIASTLLFGVLGFGIAAAFGMHRDDCLLVGLATTFSSTIISRGRIFAARRMRSARASRRMRRQRRAVVPSWFSSMGVSTPIDVSTRKSKLFQKWAK